MSERLRVGRHPVVRTSLAGEPTSTGTSTPRRIGRNLGVHADPQQDFSRQSTRAHTLTAAHVVDLTWNSLVRELQIRLDDVGHVKIVAYRVLITHGEPLL